MNHIINKFVLAGDKFMPEMHLRQPQFTYRTCHLLSINQEFKSLQKLEIHTIYIKMNLIKLVLLMMHPIRIVKILQKELLQLQF